ncbi:AAA family ATPase [Asaia sp. HN010]|uniref:AAA family ATPase n=1 Tax=Asaia sp. HN010 TaxID=3081233 RepID=UPI00301A8C21
MHLHSVRLKNFRGYRKSTTVPFEPTITGLVGRNDYGKSTILEALGIFFEAEGIKSDKSDMNCFAVQDSEEQFEISCIFDGLPPSIVLDDTVETSLSEECLLNEDGLLEVVKQYKASTGKIEGTYLRCSHPNHPDISTLLATKIGELRKLGETRGVAEHVPDKRVASFWRRAIRASYTPTTLHETLLDVNKGLSLDSKAIWQKIQDLLPTFALFKADRESNDGDSEAKNPLQQAVKEAQLAYQKEINELEDKVTRSVLDVANRTLSKLSEMAPDIAQALTPVFKEKPKWVFNFSLEGDNGIPINKRGSGVRRLVLLNFFRAEAEKSAHGTQRNVIYAIEEPETSQHPNYQKMLMHSLLQLATQPHRQILVTTHVPALAGLLPQESVRYVTRDCENNPIVETPSPRILHEASESLGVLPEPGIERAKAIVLVEGKSDICFLNHASDSLKEAGILSTSLSDLGVVPIMMGGCGSVKHWVTLRLADKIGVPWCVFIDSDVGGGAEAEASLAKRRREIESAGKKLYTTRKREIENYICTEMLFQKTDKRIAYTDTCDAKKIIGTALRINPNDVIDKYWPLMSADMIQNCSSYEENNSTHYEIKELIEEISRTIFSTEASASL